MHKRLRFRSVVWTRLAVFSLITLLQISPLRADLVLVGDTDPMTFSDAAGDVGGDLIVGVTGVGGLFMDVAPPLSGTLMHLISDDGIIGAGPDSIGAAVFDDFGVVWEVGDELTVGNEGQGFLDVFESASIEVGSGPLGLGATFVGREVTGQGVVTLNGAASRLTTAVLTVGNLGFGEIEVIDRGALISGLSFLGRLGGGDGTVTLTGLGTRWDLRGPLNIGSPGIFNAHGFLNINDRALLQARAVASVTVNPTGLVNLAGGTLRQIGGSPVTNEGVIRGDGFIDAAMSISPSGELRNAAATANEREYLLVSGEVTNDGTIESLGGEMEFESAVTNNFEFIARDAVMRVPGGIINDSGGIVILGGETTIHGNIDSSGGGTIVTLPNSDILVASDIIFSSSVASLTAAIGGSSSTLTVAGTATLDGFLSLNYSGAPSVPGDSYDILFATGGISGSFDNFANRAPADGRLWAIANSGTVLTVTATGLAVMPMGADFNGDGIVDEQDIAIWEMNIGSMGPPGSLGTMGDADGDGDVDGLDFLKIQRDFGVIPVPPLAAATAAVPEPSALMLALLALAFGCRRRVA